MTDQSNNEHAREKFLDLLRRFDALASSAKKCHQIFWVTVWALVWVMLIVSILGMAFPQFETIREVPVHDIVLQYVIPIMGIIVTVLTVVQIFFRFSVKWTSYRSAAEQMSSACMTYRAELPPFDDPTDALLKLGERIESIEKRAGQGKEFQWSYLLYALRIPADVPDKTMSAPHDGIATRISDQTSVQFESSVIDGRLMNQRRYYAVAASRYLRRFVGCQAIIALMSGINVAYTSFVGRDFAVVALVTTVSLAVIAWRDAADYLERAFHFLRTADELKGIHDAYEQSKVGQNEIPTNEGGDESALEQNPYKALFRGDLEIKQRLQNLTNAVETALSQEIDVWYSRLG